MGETGRKRFMLFYYVKKKERKSNQMHWKC